MLYSPHFLTGAAVLSVVQNPLIGLPVAFASHILLDLTPHNDFDLRPGITLKEFFQMEKKRRNTILIVMGVDYALLIVCFFWLLIAKKSYWLMLGGGAGVFPDAFEQFLMLLGKKLPGWQDKLQWRVPAKYGFISYPIVSLIAFWILLKN